MKKILFIGALALSASLYAESIKLTNTLGGNTDNIGGNDFLRFDDNWNKSDASINDRLQLDVSSKYIDSRVRLDFTTSDSSGKESKVQTRGYVNFKPQDYLNFSFGNKFFGKWTVTPGYLASSDDYTTSAKLLNDGGYGVVLGKDKAKVALGNGYDSKLQLNSGFDLKLTDTVALGGTFQDLTNDTRSFAGFLSYKGKFYTGGGYIYNHKGDYLIPTEHALQLSASYEIKSLPVGFYGDYLTGLTDKYINNDGYRESLDNFLPYFVSLRTKVESGNLSFNAKVTGSNNKNNLNSFTVYPYLDFKTEVGTFRGGLRVTFNDDIGYKSFNIPLSWQYSIKK